LRAAIKPSYGITPQHVEKRRKIASTPISAIDVSRLYACVRISSTLDMFQG
jgi:hypothetical protein